MNCGLSFNTAEKQIVVSSQTACEWSCVVMRGNITLNKYYGKFEKSGSTDVRIFTYGTKEMFGEVECHFKHGNCSDVKHISITTTPLPFFYLTNNKLFLFGNDTYSYAYLYYGTPYINSEKTLSNLKFTINDVVNTDFIYSGTTTSKTISFNNFELYDIILSNYNSALGCVEICIHSKTDEKFVDALIIDIEQTLNDYQYETTRVIVDIRQDIAQNLPTLLTISPTFIFLDSKNPKQKINVTSLYRGKSSGYELSSTEPVKEETKQITNYSNSVEEYLNYYSIEPYENENLDLLQLITDKNASHFILDMSGRNENDENINGQIGYKIYVVNSLDKSYYQRLEFFYDYIRDPNNFIEISEVSGVYAYVSHEIENGKQKIYEATKDTNKIVFSGTKISGQSSITLYFSKDKINLANEPNLAKYQDHIFAKYQENANVVFKIKSIPEWWRILSQSEYVREVKQGDELIITLEDEIPNNENAYITLENRLGSVCSIFIKSDENIFNKNVYTFGFINGDTVESNKEVIFNEVQNPLCLKSSSLNEEIYYVANKYIVNSNAKYVTIPTIKYPDTIKDSNAQINIDDENFDILYNQNINKYYINYSSISIVNGKKEKNDNLIYYFEGNSKTEIIVPIPKLTRFVPWNIINKGSSISFNIYKGEVNGNDKKCVLINNNIPTYFPTSEITNIKILKVLPTENEIVNECIYIIPNTILNNINDVSCIIFQQLKSYNDAHLYVNFSSNSSVNIVNKYGYTVKLDDMINIPYYEFIDAYSAVTDSSKNLSIKIPRNKEKSMFYATYSKKSEFLIEFNDNVNFYIPKEMIIETNIEELQTLYNCTSSNPNYTLYSGTTDTILTNENLEVSETFYSAVSSVTSENLIQNWKIENGFIIIITDGNEKKYFPNDPIYNISYENTYGVFIYENVISYEESSYIYFALRFNNIVEKINVDNKLIELEKDDNGEYSVAIDTFYELIPKSIKLNDKIYKIDSDNSFMYTENNTKHYCYQDENFKWYVNLPSMIFLLDENVENIKIQDKTYNFNDDGSLTYNNIQYYPNIKATIPNGFNLSLLQSVDGNGEDKDYYLILNDKKKNLNAQNKINITPFLTCELTEPSLKESVTLQNDFNINLINEPSRKYVIINWEEYFLIDDKLIYEGKEYRITTIEDKNFIVINNLGYVVHTKPSCYYYILNNDKYYYTNGNGLQIKEYSGNTNYIFKTDELYNKTFNFTIDANNLIQSNMIVATINVDNIEYVLTDSYAKKDGLKFPIKKNIFLDENDEIVSQEYVTVTSPISGASEIIIMYFYDDTVLLSDNDDFNANINISENAEFSKVISGDVKVTINDYSEVKFKTTCMFKFNNDCKIIIQETSGGTEYEYQFYKNEILYIDVCDYKIIFTDVVTITFLYNNQNNLDINVFRNIAVDSENDEIYYSSLINDQDAIIYNKNIYYIFNGQVEVTDKDTGEPRIFNVYDKYAFVKQLTSIMSNDEKIPKINILYSSEVSNIINDEEKRYGYIKNNEIVILEKDKYSDINWNIYLPYYETSSKKLKLKPYIINNVKNYYLINSNTNYNVCTIQNYNNLDISGQTKDISIENGKFQIKIDCYEVNVLNDSGETISTYYTNENRGNGFEIKINEKEYSYSIWDYYSNSYIRQSPMYLYELKNIIVKKELTINDVILNVDTYSYIQIGNEIGDYLKICPVKWKKINTNQTKEILYYWDGVTEKNIKHGEFNICTKEIYENANIFQIKNVNKTYEPVKKTYIENFKLFSSERNENPLTQKYEIINNNDGKDFVLEIHTFEVNIDGITYYGRDVDILLKEVESKLYKNYDVEYESGDTTNPEGYICLKQHNNTYLNKNDEIQIADDNITYDDNNEDYEFYFSYENKLYNVNFGVVTIPKKYKVIRFDRNALVLYDIYASLMFNMNIGLSDEIFGNVKKITFSNKLEIPHTKNILMSVTYKNNNDEDETKYGKCFLEFE